MAIRKIAHIGHPILREPAAQVDREWLVRDAGQRLIDDLIETMRDANGAGLAAPQIYEPVQICALEVDDNPRYPYKPRIPLMVLVNPVVHCLTDETFQNYEGCLSVPNLRGIVSRVAKVRVTGWDRHGHDVDMTCVGFTAGTMQHEIDHLHGRLFVDLVEDPTTLTTWDQFERHHRAEFLKSVPAIVDKYHRSQ